ncbi:MAG: transporter, family, solute carrier family 17, partial [Gammaproteobacteria bacterium]|nr:transporter, family, solute carrier family 17 [Gammaproteobacteria bacterium]
MTDLTGRLSAGRADGEVTGGALRRWPAYYTVVLLLIAAVFISYIDRTNISVGAIAMKAQLGWTETQKGLVLSSFYIGYMLLMLVTGALANRFGGKIVLGIAVIWWSFFTVFTPPAAMTSLLALVGARIALGAGEAAVFPAAMTMIGRWVPTAQRSRAVALIVSTASLSTVFALPMTGWLVHVYGWPVPFYAFGALGLIWAVAWFSKVQSGYGIEPPGNSSLANSRMAIPWRLILSTPAVWAIVITNLCFNWSYYVLGAWLPSYMKTTFGVSIVNAGLLSAAPWLASFLMGNVAGYIADGLLKAGRSATVVRKVMQTSGLVLGGLCLLALPAAGSVTGAVVLMCCAAGLLALCFAGYAPNSFDIAPRYADVIWALSNTIGTLPGIFGVFVTGWLV